MKKINANTKVRNGKILESGKRLYEYMFKESSRLRSTGTAAAFLMYICFWVFLEKGLNAETEKLRGLFCLDGVLLLGLLGKIRVSDKVRECLSVVLFLAAPAFALGAIETLHDNSVAQMKFLFVFLNYFLILTVFVILYFFINRFACLLYTSDAADD